MGSHGEACVLQSGGGFDGRAGDAGGWHAVYVIDGNNLLYAAHAEWPGPPAGRQRLCELLGRWAAGASTELTVVFDGPAPGAGLCEQMRAGGITVVFSAGRSADEVIEEMIERAARPAEIRVVTSDRAIQSAARYRQCTCIEAADFARRLASPQLSFEAEKGSTEPPPAPPEKPEELKRQEAHDWLRRFDYDPDEPPDIADLMRDR